MKAVLQLLARWTRANTKRTVLRDKWGSPKEARVVVDGDCVLERHSLGSFDDVLFEVSQVSPGVFRVVDSSGVVREVQVTRGRLTSPETGEVVF